MICVCHGDEWINEDVMMDHQVNHYATEARRLEKLCDETQGMVRIYRSTLANLLRQESEYRQRRKWFARKEEEMRRRDQALQLREANTRRIRRRLRERVLAVQDREARFILDE